MGDENKEIPTTSSSAEERNASAEALTKVQMLTEYCGTTFNNTSLFCVPLRNLRKENTRHSMVFEIHLNSRTQAREGNTRGYQLLVK